MVLFFTGSAGDFMSKISSYFSSTNVDNVAEGCNILHDTHAEYSFCCEKKSVKYYENGESVEGEFSCDEFADRFGNIERLNCEGVSC